LAIGTTQELLDKALGSPDRNGHSFVDTIMMALLLLVKTLQHSDAHNVAEKACQSKLLSQTKWYNSTIIPPSRHCKEGRLCFG
jgi:hypothetical protein